MQRINDHTRIYLTGFMGSGKSTLGPAVAARLGWSFLDLDDVIEKRAGLSISAIFAGEGEAGFRRREREAVEAICLRDHLVVALGGGAFLDEANRRCLRSTGAVVCLTARLSTLVDRLVSEAPARPLLQDDSGVALDAEALAARIRSLLRARRTAYETAHVMVDTDEGSIEETVDRIIEAVSSASSDNGEDGP